MGKATLLEKHYAPALECFLPALQLLRSSKELESTLDCASVLGSLGFLHLKLRKFTESSNFLRECLRLYEMNGEFVLCYVPCSLLVCLISDSHNKNPFFWFRCGWQ